MGNQYIAIKKIIGNGSQRQNIYHDHPLEIWAGPNIGRVLAFTHYGKTAYQIFRTQYYQNMESQTADDVVSKTETQEYCPFYLKQSGRRFLSIVKSWAVIKMMSFILQTFINSPIIFKSKISYWIITSASNTSISVKYTII